MKKEQGVQTFSIVIGTKACNARCPYCVSRMTGIEEVCGKPRAIHLPNFQKACGFAKTKEATSVLLTGKGEPLLYPSEIEAYLRLIKEVRWYPFIELQTNAIEISRLAAGMAPRVQGLSEDDLRDWRRLGLDTIAISAADTAQASNQQIYSRDYGPLEDTIRYLHGLDLTVRLCLMMQYPFVHTPEQVERVIDFCRREEVDQLTLRPIRRPARSEDGEASDYVREYGLKLEDEDRVGRSIKDRGTKLLSLVHGALVYDVGGQNVCLSDCLTNMPENDGIRTLVFYSNGRLCFDWQHRGSVLLRGADDPRYLTPVSDILRGCHKR